MDLRQHFLNDARDPSDFCAFAYFEDYTPARTKGGGVETGYASGRSRLWTSADDGWIIPLTFRFVTPAQIQWLEDHRGTEVCWRDPLGRKVFVSYQVAPPTVTAGYRDLDWNANDSASVELTSVTWSEAV